MKKKIKKESGGHLASHSKNRLVIIALKQRMIYRNDSHTFYGAGSRYYHSSAFFEFSPDSSFEE